MNAGVLGGVLDALPGKIKSALGHLGLSPIGVAGDNGDAHPILLAALEVHPFVGPTGILPKYGVESDERLNDVNPFGVTNAAKALEANGEQRRCYRARGVQKSSCLLQHRFEQSKLEKRSDVPQFADSERLLLLDRKSTR